MASESVHKMDMGGEQPDTAERMGVANGHEPVARKVRAQDPLAWRIARIRAEAHNIGKEKIDAGSYKFDGHTVEGVLAGIRPLLEKYGVDVMPNYVSHEYNGNRCDVIYEFTWMNLDDPTDIRVIRWPGADTDKGGKALAKAGTNATKEMFKKVLLITDRDDAKEETETVDFQSDEGMSRAAVDDAREKARQLFESWAIGYRNQIKAATDTKALRRLKADNAATLANPDLPPATRTFLEAEYEERNRILKEFEDEASENEETLA